MMKTVSERESKMTRLNWIRSERWLSHLQLRRSAPKALDLTELLALIAAALLLCMALFAYFYLLAPARTRLDEAQRERMRLQRQLRASTEGIEHRANAQATVAEILQSLDSFERNFLAPRGAMQTTVLQTLNELIKRNDLRLSEAMTFTPVETATDGRRSTLSSGDEAPSIFPSLKINLTVEGSYPNLRHFINDLEISRQFITINGMELEGVSERDERGASVRLRLDLTAYFRREPDSSLEVADELTREQ